MKRRSRSDHSAERHAQGGAPTGTVFAIETYRAMWLWALLTLGLKSLIFAPISWWPLSFVCLVPWLIMIGGATHAPRVYFHSYLLGLAFFLWNMRWLYPATGLGYVALSVYLACYFPLVACPLRHVVRRRRWPLALALPLVWVGSEMLRAVVISGFPWFYLSHSLYEVLTLIQVSDLLGAYGVTFMVASVNGAIADVVFARLARRRGLEPGVGFRHERFSVGVAALLVLAVVVYGQVQLRRDTISAGPRIAVIQGDFLSAVFPEGLKEHDQATDREKMEVYLSMMEAAAGEGTDLYLLPETPWTMYLNPDARGYSRLSRDSFARLQEHATRHRAYVVTGSASAELSPHAIVDKERRYNSATVFSPDGSEPERYDKIHVVYFGETVPFRYGRFRFLYFWLNSIMPFSGPDGSFEYSLFRGRSFRAFSMKAAPGASRAYRFGIPICYEDVMPYVSREFVSAGSNEKKVDFLLNISNDGWFGRGMQQPQHLAICVFRAVENRVGIARAVNTGVSAFIEPTGRVHDVVQGDPSTPWPGECGFAVAAVGVDSRHSSYSRRGDWFAWGCAFFWLALFVDYWIARARAMRDAEASGAGV